MQQIINSIILKSSKPSYLSLFLLIQIKMSIQQDPRQVIRYFADFLNEINSITSNIKQFVYDLIDVRLSPSKSSIKCASMSSIIRGTHKIFDDLKKIQSILSGVIKSKQTVGRRHSCYSSKSRANTFHFASQTFTNDLKLKSQFQNPSQKGQTSDKTVKRTALSKNQQKQQLQKSASSSSFFVKTINRNISEIPHQYQKSTYDRGVQYLASDIQNHQSGNGGALQQHITSIIKFNSSSLSKLMQRNSECLRLVRSAKKQLRVRR